MVTESPTELSLNGLAAGCGMCMNGAARTAGAKACSPPPCHCSSSNTGSSTRSGTGQHTQKSRRSCRGRCFMLHPRSRPNTAAAPPPNGKSAFLGVRVVWHSPFRPPHLPGHRLGVLPPPPPPGVHCEAIKWIGPGKARQSCEAQACSMHTPYGVCNHNHIWGRLCRAWGGDVWGNAHDMYNMHPAQIDLDA